MIAPELLELLRCPVSGATLIDTGDWLVSTDEATRRRYPVRDGIPVFLPEEAEEMGVTEWREVQP